MSRNDDIETALRSMDAADLGDRATGAQAGDVLERILHSDLDRGLAAVPARRAGAAPHRRARRTVRRALVAGAVVTAVSAGLVVLPTVSGGDQALASWTPDPDAVPATERTAAAEACRDQSQSGDYADQIGAAEPAIAERRGTWTAVVLAGNNGFTALCITDESSPFWARGSIGSIGTPTGFVAPGPRDLIATDLGSGITNNAELSLAAGYAGSDVAGVVYRSLTHGVVTATVSRGHFALWLPGGELEDASRGGVEFDVTYRDGSTGSTQLML